MLLVLDCWRAILSKHRAVNKANVCVLLSVFQMHECWNTYRLSSKSYSSKEKIQQLSGQPHLGVLLPQSQHQAIWQIQLMFSAKAVTNRFELYMHLEIAENILEYSSLVESTFFQTIYSALQLCQYRSIHSSERCK